MSQPNAQELNLEQLVALARHAAEVPVDPDLDRLGRVRLIERTTRRRSLAVQWGSWFTPLPKFTWALAAVCAMAAVLYGLSSRPVSFVVRDATAPSAYVRAPEDRPTDVDFSDGSRIHAEVGARFRLLERSNQGARILVERGRSTVSIVHRKGANWSFLAGPFEVKVIGTRFWLDWDPSSERFDLGLEEGAVEVVGPLSPSRVTVRAGQQLRASMPQRSLTVFDPLHSTADVASPAAESLPAESLPAATVDGSRKASAAPKAGPVVSAPAQGIEAESTKPAESPENPATSLSWSKMLAKGQFEAIVRLAESPSHPNCIETCAATDLRVLAEAARYVGRTDLAESSLMALRRRFFGNSEAKKAAFLLARLYEARADRGRAEIWYQTYQSESPTSELAADALAGQMRVVRRARGTKAAEPLAQEYLRRYPGGVHAAAAQQILQDQQ